MNDKYKYLGTGIQWPIKVNDLGQASLSSGLELIAQSCLRYLETPIGTEFFNEDVGSRINQIGFEPVDEVLFNLLEMIISETIETFEKRVQYVETEFFSGNTEEDQSVIQCRVWVRPKNGTEPFWFIWPYYNEKPTQI